MRKKISKFLNRTIFLVASVLTAIFLKAAHALAQEFNPNTVIIYGPPELIACGGNKLCYSLLLYWSRLSWISAIIVLLVLLAIPFGIVKLITKVVRRKKQNQKIQPPKSTDGLPKQ